jgi:hypothetical protein
MTFDLTQQNFLGKQYDWQLWYEAFCLCRHCKKATIFTLSLKEYRLKELVQQNGLLELPDAVNRYMKIEGYVSLKDRAALPAPEHVPPAIKAAFDEGAKCLAIDCPNAAATMFRLCLDLATRPRLPDGEPEGLNKKVRRDLGLRLPWLFDHGHLPADLRELSHCVKEDGNDGAHVGSLKMPDAEDLLDFTTALLARFYTEPERVRLAAERREERRKPKPV